MSREGAQGAARARERERERDREREESLKMSERERQRDRARARCLIHRLVLDAKHPGVDAVEPTKLVVGVELL